MSVALILVVLGMPGRFMAAVRVLLDRESAQWVINLVATLSLLASAHLGVLLWVWLVGIVPLSGSLARPILAIPAVLLWAMIIFELSRLLWPVMLRLLEACDRMTK
ncbi:MAG: hypothetical protein EA401_08470 [Planctomycetota bacterium]|nr:MAG: hypothetical protein EA401_08470 [Planctomycetota bacterium]